MTTNLHPSKPTKHQTGLFKKILLILLPMLFMGISDLQAQCIGPYQYFESIPSNPLVSNQSAGLNANGWAHSLATLSTTTGAAYSGRYCVALNATTRYIQTPILTNPGSFSFYWKCTSGSGYTFEVRHSTDPTFATSTLLGTYNGTTTAPWQQLSFDLVAAGVPANSYVRIQCAAASPKSFFVDDLAVTSSLASQNTIIVPQTGSAANCNFNLVSGRTYTFYDNGGASDSYSPSQNNNMTFVPAVGEQVELTFTAFNSTTGTIGFTNTSPALASYTGGTLPGVTTYLGTAADVNVGVNFTSTTGTTPTAGYTITVRCIPPVATCSDVTGVNVSSGSVTATTATVNWTPPGAIPSNGYDYYVQTTSTPAPTSGTTPTGHFASGVSGSMTGLSASTTYYVWVRSNCNNPYGNWVLAAAPFTTKCSAYPIPYVEDFNGLNGPLPTCTSSDTSSAYFTNITNGNLFTAVEGATFFTKPVSLLAGQTYRLSFDYGTINGTADFDVNYGSTNFTPTTLNINVLVNSYSGASALSTGVYNFMPGSTGTYYVGYTLQGVDSPGSTQFNLDNISIDLETCFPPTALTPSAVTATTATVSWTPPVSTPSNGYQYYISTLNVQPDYSTAPTGTSTASPLNLSGLTSGTTYYIWVRSNCAGRYSVWSAVGTFTTITVTVTTVTMPVSTSTIIPMNCNNIYNFFDSGGSAAAYVDNETGTITFTPGVGRKVKVVFSSFSTESGWDGLSIYNGPNTGSPLISSGLAAGFNATTCPAGSYYGTTSPGTIISTAANGELTFHFTSDFIITRPGWSATVTCVTAPKIDSFTPGNNSCVPGTVVTITGSNFSGIGVPAVTGVYFGGLAAASWTVNSATQITATLPVGASTGVISVTNTEAVAYSATQFQVYLPAPATTGVTICAGGSGSLSTSSVCTGFNQSTPTITGALNGATDPVAPRPQTSTSNSTICGFAGVTSNYVGIQFQVSATGLYNFEMSSTPTVDGMGYITTGAFTPGSCATGTYVIGDDDSGVGTFPAMSVNLTQGVTYTLWTTVWSFSSTTYTGNFTWSVSSPGGGSALLYSNAQMEWYLAATGGTAIGTGSSFNPVGVAGSGLPNTNTAGTYNFYAGCSSNPNCRTLTTFVINPIATAGTVSANQTICSGTSPANITLTGSAGNIQWQSSPDNSTWTNIPSATATPLTSAQMGTQTAVRYFRAILTSPSCGTATSAVVTVNVNPVSVAGTITPASTNVCTGTNSTLLTLTGNTGTIQWQSSPDNSTWTNIGAATGATYTATNLIATTYYRVVVTSGVCTSVNSASVVINVNPVTVAGSVTPATTNICAGTNSTLLTLAGNTGTIQWQSSPNNSTWTNIGAATAATYTATNLSATTYYRAVVTSGACSALNTASVVINVSPATVAGTAASGQIICPGNTPADMTLTGNTGSIQWQSSPDNSVWTNVSPGGTGNTLLGSTVGALASTRYFRAVVTSGVCPPANSNTITITVTPAVGGTSSPASQNTCTTVSNLTVAGYTGTILRWEWATTAGFGTPNTIPASASATLTAAQIGAFSGTRYYRAVISSGTCTAYSSIADITYSSTTYNGATWSNGVPNNTIAAIFSGDYTMTGSMSACSVHILSGADITVNPGVVLTVQNEVIVDAGGTLTFENTSSLIQVNDAAVNNGFVTYKRTTTGMHMYDYTYWSSPLFPQTLFGVSPLTLFDKYFSFNTALNQYAYENSSNIMVPGKGYIIRAPQGWPISPAAPATFTAIFNGGSGNGVPNNGVININAVVSGGNVMNLLGNPYPSALDADAFLSHPGNANAIDGTIYLWTHNTPINSNQYTGSDYAIYNLNGGVGTAAATNPGVNMQVPNGNIGAGQGFFVKGINSGGTVTYNNSMRGTNNVQFYRPAATGGHGNTPSSFEKNRYWLELKNDLGAYKQMLVGYIETATNGRDRNFDGDFVDAGNVVGMYTISGTEKYSIQGRALPFDLNDQLPLGYKITYAGTYQINLADFDGLFTTQNVYLEDKLLNVIHNLKTGSYSFATLAGTFDERFVLRYTDGTALGVGEHMFNDNSVIVYKNDGGININTTNVNMASVKIFDMRGRLIAQKDDINATEYRFANLPETQQVLLVKITSDEGATVTKKVVY